MDGDYIVQTHPPLRLESYAKIQARERVLAQVAEEQPSAGTYQPRVRVRPAPQPVVVEPSPAAAAPAAPVAAGIIPPEMWEERIRLERAVADANAKAKASEDARLAAERHAAEKADMQRKLDELKAAQEKAEVQRQLDELKAAINRPQAAPVEDMAAVIARTMTMQLQALGLIEVGPDGQPRRVGAAAPAAPPPPASQSAEDLADRIIAHEKTANEARSKLAQALGLKDKNEATAVVDSDDEDEEEESVSRAGSRRLRRCGRPE